ncbi:MAG: hypothetical protein Q9228_002016 [Teloschistes exilis]
MPLRKAHRGDLPAIAEIYAAAFYDDELLGSLLHPHRHSYPSHYHRYWEHRVTEWYWDYQHQLIVTYTLTSSGGENVTGVADWKRFGDGWEKYWGIWAPLDLRLLVSYSLIWYHEILLYLSPNFAADQSMNGTLSIASSHTKHIWSRARASGWYLNFLAVDPAQQSQGYGRVLATWGLERARQENVAASVISGPDKDRFYRRCGFDIKAGDFTEGEGNPLKGKIKGGTILFCDAKNQ